MKVNIFPNWQKHTEKRIIQKYHVIFPLCLPYRTKHFPFGVLLSRYFWTGHGEKNRFLELSRTKYGIESAKFLKFLIFKAGIDWFFPCLQLPYCLRAGNVLSDCWPIGVSFPHTQHMKKTILKSSIPAHGSMSPKINSTTELISHKESIRCH